MKIILININRLLALGYSLITVLTVSAQNNDGVSISNNHTEPDELAIFHVYSPASPDFKGMIIPRMTYAEMLTIDPTLTSSNGLTVYLTDASKLGYWFWDENHEQTQDDGWVRMAPQIWKENGDEIYYDIDKVGVGTTDPYRLFHVYGSEPYVRIERENYDPLCNCDGTFPMIEFLVEDETSCSGQPDIGVIEFKPFRLTVTEGCGEDPEPAVCCDGGFFFSHDIRTPYDLFVDGKGTLNQVDVDGAVNIGGAVSMSNTLTVEGATTVGGATELYGTVYISNDVTSDGDIYAPNFVETSDSTLKTNKKLLQFYGNNPILDVNTYSFNFKEGYDNGRNHFGVMAQELELLLPQMVAESQDGIKSVHYTEFIPLLIEQVKEHEKEINHLKSSNNDLQKKVDDLEARIAKLESLLTK